VFEHLHAVRPRMLLRGHNHKNGGGVPTGGGSVAPTHDERTVLTPADGFEQIVG
jgi:hypothetical protein